MFFLQLLSQADDDGGASAAMAAMAFDEDEKLARQLQEEEVGEKY